MALALALAGGPYSVLLIDSRARCLGPTRVPWRCRTVAASSSNASAPGTAAGTPIRRFTSRNATASAAPDRRRDYGMPALGYVMRYRDLAATLDARIDRTQLLN
jgi:2-polyprenyl-6-methoxyphenol hydroxylase-like FAD-dependent oxidoreductase